MGPTPTTPRWRTTAWTAVRLLLGGLLLAAAGLKLAGQGVSAVPRAGWFATPLVQIAAAEWELVLGVWLLSGRFSIGAWLAAVGTFLTFAAVSGYLGWVGQSSCGCFGTLKASPFHALAVDLVALLMLGVFRPAVPARPRYAPHELRRRAAVGLGYGVGILGLLAIVTAAGSRAWGSPEAALARLRGETITAQSSYIDFGLGEPGQTLESAVVVANWSRREIRLVGGTSDCSCVALGPFPLAVPAGESRTVRLDLKLPHAGAGGFTRKVTLWTDSDDQRIVRLLVGGTTVGTGAGAGKTGSP